MKSSVSGGLRPLLLALLCSIASASCALRDTPAVAPSADQPYLILISIDGFRHDYHDRFPTPALDRLAAHGVRAQSMQPVWPTLTFPNHFSIATGLYPVDHGIVANDFPDAARRSWYHKNDRQSVQDGDWYSGEPIWVAAENAGMTSAAFFFVGSEAAVAGVSPTYWTPFDASISGDTRIEQVLDWLALPASERPQMISLYFEQVDDASHRYGPGSPESIAAIAEVDGWIGRLLDGIDAIAIGPRVHVVVVSDHGQLSYRDDPEPFILSEVIGLDGVTVVDGHSHALLYVAGGDQVHARKLRDAINAKWQHGRAWLRDEAPAEWRVRGSERLGEVLLQADPGYVVVSTERKLPIRNRGTHGWSPGTSEMQGVFIAAGPRLPAGKVLDTVHATDIYPLLLELLGLPDRRDPAPRSPLCELLSSSAACARPGR